MAKRKVKTNKLSKEDVFVFSELKKRRNIVNVEQIKLKSIIITKLGEEILKQDIKDDYIETLTVEILKNSSWKNKEFRHYNIHSVTPKIYGGRIHPLSLVIQKIKKVFLKFTHCSTVCRATP